MVRLFYKKFDDPSERIQSMIYRDHLWDLVEKQGFDSSIVHYNVECEYRCSHRYPDYIEVYIETDDRIEISALSIVGY